MNNEFTIKLSERDRKRLIKYYEAKLNSLGYEKILEEIDIELYNPNENSYYKRRPLTTLKRRLAIIKNDIKMFEKLKKALEVEDE